MTESHNPWTNPWYSRQERLVHCGILFILMGVNLWLSNHGAGEMVSLGGIFYSNSNGLLISTLLHVTVSYNVLGFALGNFIAMLPMKNLRYEHKYGKLSFLSMIAVQLGFMIYGIILLRA